MHRADFLKLFLVILTINLFGYLLDPISSIPFLGLFISIIPWFLAAYFIYKFYIEYDAINRVLALKYVIIMLLTISVSKMIYQILLFSVIDPDLKEQLASIRVDNMVKRLEEKSKQELRNYTYDYNKLYKEAIDSFKVTKIILSTLIFIPIDVVIGLALSFFLRKSDIKNEEN